MLGYDRVMIVLIYLDLYDMTGIRHLELSAW